MALIILVRHGSPVRDQATRIRGSHFVQWADAYQLAPLDPRSTPPAELRAKVADVACIVTSSMRRAIESAQALAPGRLLLSDPLFNEARVPTALALPLRLKPHHWSVFARAAWFMGWSPDVESFGKANARARAAAVRLAGLAASHGSVVLVGHGILNGLIARALRQEGWTGGGTTRRHWESVQLTKVHNRRVET